MSAWIPLMHQELQEFERRADVAIAKLSLWQQPIRSILSHIYLSADHLYVGARFNRRGPRNDESATAMITRLSYVARFFDKCSRQLGTDIDDALSVADDEFQADISQLLAYAHFCEIMPLVWRGSFSVERRPSVFKLNHPNAEFAKHEEYDILMSEMVMPHALTPPPYPVENLERMVSVLPKRLPDVQKEVLNQAYDHYMRNVFELPLLSDRAFEVSFDFSRTDFIRVRAALMAFSDFCLGMADTAEVLSVRPFTCPPRAILQREVREWAAPLLDRRHIIDVAASVAGVEPFAAERIVDLFTVDLDNLDGSGADEGFFPPFLKLENALLFSPHAVKRTMPERNLMYSMVRIDRRRFDNVVSSHLEPALLDDAAEFLSRLPGVEVKKNVNWEEGEIDVLVYHEASNSAFQLQAKACVPPQGARMVAHVESRTREAANQVERFLRLSDNRKDGICSSAIGRKLSGISWCSGILVRTCLGTERAWSGIAGYVPLNPVLLRAAVKRMCECGEFTFMMFGKVVEAELTNLRSTAVLGWENKSITLFGEMFELPFLELDYAAISDFRGRVVS